MALFNYTACLVHCYSRYKNICELLSTIICAIYKGRHDMIRVYNHGERHTWYIIARSARLIWRQEVTWHSHHSSSSVSTIPTPWPLLGLRSAPLAVWLADVCARAGRAGRLPGALTTGAPCRRRLPSRRAPCGAPGTRRRGSPSWSARARGRGARSARAAGARRRAGGRAPTRRRRDSGPPPAWGRSRCARSAGGRPPRPSRPAALQHRAGGVSERGRAERGGAGRGEGGNRAPWTWKERTWTGLEAGIIMVRKDIVLVRDKQKHGQDMK